MNENSERTTIGGLAAFSSRHRVWVAATAGAIVVALVAAIVVVAGARQAQAESADLVRVAAQECIDARTALQSTLDDTDLFALADTSADAGTFTATYSDAQSLLETSCSAAPGASAGDNEARATALQEITAQLTSAAAAVKTAVDVFEDELAAAELATVIDEFEAAKKDLVAVLAEAKTLYEATAGEVSEDSTVREVLHDAVENAAALTSAPTPTAIDDVQVARDAAVAAHGDVDAAMTAATEAHDTWVTSQETKKSKAAAPVDAVTTPATSVKDSAKKTTTPKTSTSKASTPSAKKSTTTTKKKTSSAKAPKKDSDEPKAIKPKPKPKPKPAGVVTWGKCVPGEGQNKYIDGEYVGIRGCAIASDVRARIADDPGVACSPYGSMTADSRQNLIAYAERFLALGHAYFEVAQANETQVTVTVYLCGDPE